MKIPTRTLVDIRNDLVRIQENIKIVKNDDRFSAKDEEILLPKYLADEKKLKAEYKKLKKKTPTIKEPQPRTF